jgi:hypothetical protein
MLVVVVEVGTVVVVVEVGVVVVVVVAVVPPELGVDPAPATVSVAAVGDAPPGRPGTLATTPAEGLCAAFAAETGPVPPVGLATVPAFPMPGTVPAPGSVVTVDPEGATTGPEECADRTDCATGPAPMLRPATTESAAATTAPAATTRLRTKYSADAVIVSAVTGRDGTAGNGCPNERDVKTSSNVA